ncbi:MAG: crotonase/enoyl-CoA hydratase family protein [Acidimicrobiales bacterium]
MDERVTISIADGVADVRLNRPDKLNALDMAMFDALVAAGDRLEGEESLRAVVLSGEGRAFCAGLDFASFMGMADGGGGDGGGGRASSAEGASRLVATEGRITHRAQQAAWCWQEVPVPVIAALHGAVLGGGLQIALGADLRVVAPDAQLAVAEVRWGLSPDMTASVTLPRLVGLDVAKELAFTGRSVDGVEAARIGLATRLADDPRSAALALAAEIAEKNPHAVRAMKRLFNRAGRLAPGDIAAQLALEREVIADLIGSPNQVEAVMARFEKRSPVFQD